MQRLTPRKLAEVRGQKAKANPELEVVIQQTARLWRKAHLSYDQSRYVVERVRRLLELEPPPARRRVVQRLSREEVERLLEAAYRLHPRKPVYGLMLKTLFYTGVRVSEFVFLRAQDAHLDGEAPLLYVHKAKKGAVRYVPLLPALAQELRVHLAGRTRGYLFESNRHERYSPGPSRSSSRPPRRRRASRSGSTPTCSGTRWRSSCSTGGCPWSSYRSFWGTGISRPPRSTPRARWRAWGRATGGC